MARGITIDEFNRQWLQVGLLTREACFRTLGAGRFESPREMVGQA
jgi:hypothetical protein